LSERGRQGDKGNPPARPPTGGGGAKLLLSRLRALMANQAQDPKRLERVVELIANTMVADVCSIYLRTEDEALLLAATKGLRPEAVGRTKLKENEGLVGLVDGCVLAPAFLLQAGDRRGSVPFLPRRTDPAWRAGAGRSGRAEQGRTRLRR
jgi:phosphotransferase system enzyme I (PtsP)